MQKSDLTDGEEDDDPVVALPLDSFVSWEDVAVDAVFLDGDGERDDDRVDLRFHGQ